MNELAKQIETYNHNLAEQVPPEILTALGQAIVDLKTRNLEETSIKVGDRFPAFSLPNANAKIINSKEMLKNGKMIVVFYRGSWCPYCNLELRFLQENLSKFTSKKATLVAVSPQSQENNAMMIEKHHLTFEVLTDKCNKLAEQLGICFQLQDFVLPHYQSLGINLSDINKNEENTLPIPAVFVMDRNGTIIYKFADANYINRVDIEELIKVL